MSHNPVNTKDPSRATLAIANAMALEASALIALHSPRGISEEDAKAACALAAGTYLIATCRATGANIVEVLRDTLRHLGPGHTPSGTMH